METVLGPAASVQMYKRPTGVQVEGNFRKTKKQAVNKCKLSSPK